jgi:hypothetical protein
LTIFNITHLMKKFFLAFGLVATLSPAFAKDSHGEEYNKSVFRNHPAKRNNAAISQTNKIAQAAFPKWGITVDKANGMISDIYGPGLTLPGSTNLQRAQNCMSEKMAGLGVIAGEWVMYRDLQTARAGYVDYSQVINGHKVVFSRLGFRFSADGKLVRVQMKNYGSPQNYTAPAITGSDALIAAAQDLAGTTITSSTVNSDWEWFPVPTGTGYELHPAWTFNIKGTDLHRDEMSLKGYVDAITGEVLYRTNEVKFDYDLTVNGSVLVNGFAQPATVEPLANLKLTVNGGTEYTNSLGYFSNTSLTIPDLTTITLAGRWSTVRDAPSSNTVPSLQQNVTALGTTYTYPTSGLAQSRHINAYYHVNKIHDYMKSHLTTFTGMDFALPTNVDLTNGNCNAFYNGTSINFYAASNGCNSFAEIGDIVYHEYGHGINDKFYQAQGINGGMNNGGLNEGYADVWAMCTWDNPILGENCYVGGGFIRRYDVAPKVYPQDLVGQVHADGEIIAGAWWDVRENVNSIDTMARIFTDAFYDTPDGPDGQEGPIYHAALISALMADDDDANINNGTPHFLEIVEAFAEHGIYLLSDAEVVHNEVANHYENNTITINTTLNITYQPFLKDVILMYRVRPTTAYTAITMTDLGNLNYTADIPAQSGTKIVDYYFAIRDTLVVTNAYGPLNFNPTITSVQSNIPYQFGVQVTGIFVEHFENALTGWTVGNCPAVGLNTADNATAGKWIQAIPVAASAGGELSQTGADHTTGTGQCLVTGNASNSSQGVGSADVDNGKTSVLTPVFDISTFQNPIVEYYRWYSNNRGSNAGTEKWEVKIGTPTQTLWPNVENTFISDQSWRRRIFRVRDYIFTANQIQLLFIANDATTNGGCVVEAAMDDFILYDAAWPTNVGGTPTVEKADIYPNPANTAVNITLPSKAVGAGTIGIYDLTGKVIQQVALEDGKTQYELNTTSVASGVYFLMIKADNIIQSQKLVVTH